VRFWTVEEARAYLPRLRVLVETVRGAVATAASAKGNGHGKEAGQSSVSIADALAEIEDGDIILRDPSTGLIDFHARGDDGVVYFLCWRIDEDELAWWHLPEEGFAGRKPLPRRQ
jgi:hypothetical protein